MGRWGCREGFCLSVATRIQSPSIRLNTLGGPSCSPPPFPTPPPHGLRRNSGGEHCLADTAEFPGALRSQAAGHSQGHWDSHLVGDTLGSVTERREEQEAPMSCLCPAGSRGAHQGCGQPPGPL